MNYEFYINLLINSNDPVLRNRAALWLGKNGRNYKRIIISLINALEDSAWRVRGNAAKSLAKLDPHNTVVFDKILNLITDSAEAVRIEAFFSLEFMIENGYCCSESQIGVICHYFYNKNLDNRENVIRVLGKLKIWTLDSFGVIAAAVMDPSEEVQYWAIEAATSSREAVARILPELIDCLRNGSEQIKYSCLSAMSILGKEAAPAIPAIRQLLNAQEQNLRFMAAYIIFKIIGNIPDAFVETVLQEALNSGNADERRLAATAFGENPDVT